MTKFICSYDQDTYNTWIRYKCVDGSQFDTDLDGKGDQLHIDIRCQWNKQWQPYTKLPECKITHCVDPEPIPEDSNLKVCFARA